MTIQPLTPTTYAATLPRGYTPTRLMTRLKALLPLPANTQIDLLVRPTGSLVLVHLPHPLAFDSLPAALSTTWELLAQGVPVELRQTGPLWRLTTPASPVSSSCLRFTYRLLLTLFPYFSEENE